MTFSPHSALLRFYTLQTFGLQEKLFWTHLFLKLAGGQGLGNDTLQLTKKSPTLCDDDFPYFILILLLWSWPKKMKKNLIQQCLEFYTNFRCVRYMWKLEFGWVVYCKCIQHVLQSLSGIRHRSDEDLTLQFPLWFGRENPFICLMVLKIC